MSHYAYSSVLAAFLASTSLFAQSSVTYQPGQPTGPSDSDGWQRATEVPQRAPAMPQVGPYQPNPQLASQPNGGQWIAPRQQAADSPPPSGYVPPGQMPPQSRQAQAPTYRPSQLPAYPQTHQTVQQPYRPTPFPIGAQEPYAPRGANSVSNFPAASRGTRAGDFPVNATDSIRVARQPGLQPQMRTVADSQPSQALSVEDMPPADVAVVPTDGEPSNDLPASTSHDAHPAESPFTVEMVKEAMKDVEASESYDAETKAQHLKFLQQAVKWLESSEEASKKLGQLQAEIDSVPARLAELEKSLAQSPAPAVPEYALEATIPQLEQSLSQAETNLAASKTKLTEHEKLADPQRRAERKAELAKLAAHAKEQLAELEKKLTSAKAGEGSDVSDSENVELKAKQASLARSAELNELEKSWLEAHAEVFPKQRDLSQRAVTRQKKLVTAWQEVITQFRTAETERQAIEARRKVSEAHPALRQFAERNAALAEERTDLAGRLDKNRTYLESVKKTLEELEKDFKTVTSRVKVVGMTPTVGLMLRNHRERLPDSGKYRQRSEANSIELQRVQMAMFDLDAERTGLGDLEETIEKTTEELAATSLPGVGPDRAHAMVREIMEARQQYIDKLLNDYDTYHDDLSDLEVVTHKLRDQIKEYRDYIDEHVLWIRSAPPMGLSSVQEMGGKLREVTDSQRGVLALPRVMWRLVVNRPGTSLVMLLGLLSLIPVRIWLGRRLEWAGTNESLSWSVTLFQLSGPILLALPGPLALCVVAQWLRNYSESSVGAILTQALLSTAAAWFIAALLRNAFHRKGLAESLFRFDAESAYVVRRQMTVVQSVIVPLVLPLSLVVHDA